MTATSSAATELRRARGANVGYARKNAAAGEADHPGARTSNLRAALTGHRILMLYATALAIVASFALPTPPIDLQLVVLAVGVGLLGVPHGALDLLAGRQDLEPRLGRWWRPVFAGLYVAAALFVLAVWNVAPLLALTTFLAISVVHFGFDDPTWIPTSFGSLSSVERVGVGSLPALVPCLAWPVEVTTIFNWLLPTTVELTNEVVRSASWVVALVVGPALLLRAGRLLRTRTTGATLSTLEMLAIAGLFIAAPPLVAFVIYFCGWHSARHMLELGYRPLHDGSIPACGSLLRAAAPLTAVTLITAVIVGLQRLDIPAMHLGEVIAPVVFIGLSALTLPHVLVLAGCRSHTAAGRSGASDNP